MKYELDLWEYSDKIQKKVTCCKFWTQVKQLSELLVSSDKICFHWFLVSKSGYTSFKWQSFHWHRFQLWQNLPLTDSQRHILLLLVPNDKSYNWSLFTSSDKSESLTLVPRDIVCFYWFPVKKATTACPQWQRKFTAGSQ